MTSIALPRIRSRRRRWKPPRPDFWLALFFVIWCIIFSIYDFLSGGSKLDDEKTYIVLIGVGQIIAGIWMLWCLHWWWRRFMREWDIWRRDE
jgi:hypothetical protein